MCKDISDCPMMPRYRQHYAQIRALLKDQPSRLLEYKLGSGWEPLCKFLDKPVPENPFPHVNESAVHDEMLDVIKVQMARGVAHFILLRLSPLLVVLGAVYWQMVVKAR